MWVAYHDSCYPEVCDDGALRLVGGSSDLNGRVEICYNEAWGTICDNQFDSADSSVVCAQLGFSRNSNEDFFSLCVTIQSHGSLICTLRLCGFGWSYLWSGNWACPHQLTAVYWQ